ncbi:MAG: ATP-binding protein [Clostridia bacterium]|nr:ATP-binding protein [Clostridia bacterium]
MIVNFRISDLQKMNENLREFAEFLRANGIAEEDVFASRLVSCELITNVIIHSGEEAEFCGELKEECIEITVTASGFENVNLSPTLPDVFAESGRGMYIVNCLSGGNLQRTGKSLKVLLKRK